MARKNGVSTWIFLLRQEISVGARSRPAKRPRYLLNSRKFRNRPVIRTRYLSCAGVFGRAEASSGYAIGTRFDESKKTLGSTFKMNNFELPRFRRLTQLLVLAVLACSLSGQAVLAQQTSANIRGQVVSTEGSPVSGAEVEITHLPSGTVARSTTGTSGQFFQGGLRI